MKLSFKKLTIYAVATALIFTVSALGDAGKAAKDSVKTPAATNQPTSVIPKGKPTLQLRGDTIFTTSGLKYIDLRPGTGGLAKEGQTVSVHYVGTFLDGKKFDSSRDRNTPYDFPLGKGKVMKGLDEGVASMKFGGLRKLIIPFNLAFGESGNDSIPPKATLIYEVELLGVK
jgi:peptidylprolyl isomerase